MNKIDEIVKKSEETTVEVFHYKSFTKKWWFRLMLYILITGVVFQTFFYFLATPFLKDYLQNKIRKDSRGVYELNFEHLTLDFTGNNIFLTGFHLKPNKKRYKELLARNEITQPLYELELTALLIYDINIYESFTKPGISIEHIDIVQPYVKIVDIPDKKLEEKDKEDKFNYDIFHQDLYPAIKNYVTALNVDFVNFTEGNFDLSLIENQNSVSKAAKISIRMNNFSVDSIISQKKDRLFYSEKIDLKIENYSLYMRKIHHYLTIDSIRAITQKEIAIYNIKLVPDTLNMSTNDTINSIVYANIPVFKLINPNITDIYFKKTISINEVLIESPSLEIVDLYKKKSKNKLNNKKAKNININPYVFIEDHFKSVKIDNFLLNNASTQFTYANSKTVNVQIPKFSMKFREFELDSTSFYKKDNFFYCKDFEFDGNEIHYAHHQNAFDLKMSNLLLSTFQKKFSISNFSLTNNNQNISKLNNISLDISFPYISAEGVNFFKLYNEQELILGSLNLDKALIKIERYNTDSIENKSLKQQESQNLVHSIIAGNINLHKAQIEYNEFKNNKLENEFKVTLSSSFSNFKYKPSKGIKSIETEYADFKDFNISLEAFYFKSKKLNYEVKSDLIALNTGDSIARILDLSINFDTLQNSFETLSMQKKNSFANLNVPRLEIFGVHAKELIYNRKLIFNTLNLVNSKIYLLNYADLTFDEIKKANVQKNIIFSSINPLKEIKKEIKTSFTEDSLRQKLAVLKNYLAINDFSKNEKKICDLCAWIDSIKNKATFNDKNVLQAEKQNHKLDSTQLLKWLVNIDVFNKISKQFDVIQFRNLNIKNTEIEVIERNKSMKRNLYAKTESSVFVRNFKFRPDSAFYTYQHFFSDSIRLIFSNSEVEIPNTIYQLKSEVLEFAFPENIISAKNLYVFEKEKLIDSLKIEKFFTFKIPAFYANGFDIRNINKHKRLELDKIYFKNPAIFQVTKLDYKKPKINTSFDSLKVADLFKFKLPENFSAITFNDLQIDTGSFLVTHERKNNIDYVFSTNFSSNISDFKLDSLLIGSFKNYNSISNFWFELTNLNQKLNDSIHSLTIDNVRFSMDTSDLIINNLNILANPKKRNYTALENLHKSAVLSLHIPKIKLKNIDLQEFYHNSNLIIDSLTVAKLYTDIEYYPELKASTKKRSFDMSKLDLYKNISAKLNSFNLKQISINSINYFSKNENLTDSIDLTDAKLTVDNIVIDSLSKYSNKLLYNDNIKVHIPYFSYSLNKFYRLKFDSISFATNAQKLGISGLVIKPRLSREAFSEQNQFRKSMLDFASTQIDVNKLDFEALILNKSINLNKLEFGTSRLHIYKDMRIEADTSLRPPMPLTLLYNAPIPIKLDTLLMSNLTLKYEERVEGANQDSRIMIDNMNLQMTNLTNNANALSNHDTALLSLNGKLMGTGFFNIDYIFLLNAYKNQYSYKGYFKPFYITHLNEYMMHSAFVKIQSGRLDRMKFNVVANDSFAYGRLHFNYHALKIEVLEKNVEEGKDNRRAMLSLLANGLIHSSNPRFEGTPSRVGQIYYPRNKEKQIFNYWVMSLISGVKSTMGFGSKQANKILKDERENLKKME